MVIYKVKLQKCNNDKPSMIYFIGDSYCNERYYLIPSCKLQPMTVHRLNRPSSILNEEGGISYTFSKKGKLHSYCNNILKFHYNGLIYSQFWNDGILTRSKNRYAYFNNNK